MKKKLAVITSGITYLLASAAAFAQGTGGETGTITIQRPGVGYSNIQDFINAALRLIFIVALIIVLFMIVWGALEWIFSGGQKEAVANARSRIVNALIGLAILAIAFAVVVVAGRFVGIDLLGTFIIPSPDNPTPLIPK